MAVNLTRKVQLGYKIQATAGTPETLSASDFTGNIKSDVSNDPDIAGYDRDLAQGSLSKRAGLRGTRFYKPNWREELVGGSASTAPRWAQALRACGFGETAVKKATCSSSWGIDPPKAGDTIANAASSPTITGRVLYVEDTGTSTYNIWYRPLTGSFINTTAVYCNGVDSGTAVTGSPAAAGFCYDPISEGTTAVPAITIQIERDGVKEVVAESRGKCSITMNINEPAMMSFEFSGLGVLDGDGDWVTASPTASVPVIAAPPKVTKDMQVLINAGDDDFEPIITEFSIDIDNTVAMRSTITSEALYDAGYIDARITDRSVKMRIDPEYITDDDAIMLNRRAVNGTTFPMLVRKGVPADTHGALVVYFPAAQMEPSVSRGDRDGVATADMNLMATGSADDECWFALLF